MTVTAPTTGREPIPGTLPEPGHQPETRFGVRIVLLAVAFLLVAGPFGFLVSQVTGNGRLVGSDRSAAERLHTWALGGAGRVGPMKAITFLGSGLWLFALVGVIAAALFVRRRPRLAVFLIATAAFGGIIDSVVKGWVGRPRPAFTHPIIIEPGKSFPSGHAMSSTVVYGAVLLIVLPLVPRRFRAVPVTAAVLLVLAIGFTRLALGAHYVTDVLGGYVLGAAWLSLSTAAFSAWRRERTGRPVSVTEGLEPAVAEPGRPEID